MKTRKPRKHKNETRHRVTPFFSKRGGLPAPEVDSEAEFFQPKLTVGQPGDRFEQEADRTADAVVSRTQSTGDRAAMRRKDAMQPQAEEEGKAVQTQTEEKEEAFQAQAEEREEEAVQTQTEEEEAVQAQAEEREEEAVQTQTEEKEEAFQAQAEEQEEEAVQAQAEEEEAVQAQAEDQEEEAVQTQTEEEEEAVQPQAEEQEEEPMRAKTERDEDQLQAKSAGKGVSPAFTKMLEEQVGRGRPLPEATRLEMEAALGADFSEVRIHIGEAAAELNRMLGAQAFTRGNDIFFNEARFNPESRAGKHLLAHELTHTLQQGKK